MAQPMMLDERLETVAALTLEALADVQAPCVADVGCDHGQLSAALLERMPSLRVLACDVSAPSLAKARRLFAARGLDDRVQLAVADGLDALTPQVGAQVVILAGMGGRTMLSILTRGQARLGGAALVLQANADVPMLRQGLAAMGYAVAREAFAVAAGRHYVVLLARPGQAAVPDARQALLGTALGGVQDAGQREYFAWQRKVRVREAEKLARTRTARAYDRLQVCGEELNWIAEVLGMRACSVADVERLVDGIAPFETAAEWDNVGLLLGCAGETVTRVLVALDLTDAAFEEAKALGAQCIVTHHPIMFSARRRVTDADREGRLMLAMARAGIAHIAAHTNLDCAPGGVNDTLMAAVGCTQVHGEGFLRVGSLPEGMTLGALAARVQRRLHGPVRVYGADDTPVRTLGCCSGAGGSELAQAAEQGVDCFLTGEVRHHEALDSLARGVCVLEAGHYETENPVCEVLTNALQNAADAVEYNVTFFCSKANPFGRNG